MSRRSVLRLTGASAAALGVTLVNPPFAKAQDMSNGANNFYVNDDVTVQKVAFQNQYHMKVAGNLFLPKTLDRNAKHPALSLPIIAGASAATNSTARRNRMAASPEDSRATPEARSRPVASSPDPE